MSLYKYFKYEFSKSDHVVLLTNGIINDNEQLNVIGYTIKPKTSLTLFEKLLDTSEQEDNHFYEIFCDDGVNKVTFYTSQRSCFEMEKLIMDTIKEKFFVIEQNQKNVIQKFKEFFDTWKKGLFGVCKLDRQDIAMKIAEILFYDHVIINCDPSFGVQVEENVEMLQNVLIQNNIICLSSCHDEVEILYHFKMEKSEIEEWGKQYLICLKSDSNNYKEIATILWQSKKFPLPLRIDQDNREMVCQLINNLQEENLSFILYDEKFSKSDFPKAQIAEYLRDLKQTEEIIKTFKLSIQGREEITLEELLKINTRFSDVISIRELILMTKAKEKFLVGDQTEILPQPYIPRCLLTKMFKSDVIERHPNDLFLISGTSSQLQSLKKKLPKQKYYNLQQYTASEDNFLPKCVVLSEDIIENPSETCSKSKIRYVHYLKTVDQEYYQWVYSKEKNEKIWKYRVVLHENQLHGTVKTTINLICARPGMGKLTLLKYLRKNCPLDYWTVTHNFREHHKDITTKEKNFALKMQHCFEEKKQVIYFFHGIDYLQHKSLEEALRYIEEIAKKGFKVWIFSEDHLRDYLENYFNAVSMDIQEFSEEQQQKYIQGRLHKKEERKNESDEQQQEYTQERLKEKKVNGLNEILKSFKKLRNNDILGAPLNLYMLTEIFNTNLEKNIKEDVNLTHIYQYFMEAKYNQYLSKEKYDYYQIINDGKYYRTEQYKLAAIASRHIGVELKCDSYFLDQIRDIGDVLGIILKVNDDDSVIFSHQTYADYFAAQWLAKNFQKIDQLETFIFREEFRNILFIFNLELLKNKPAHVAVLYQNFLQLRRQNEDKFDELDSVGRTLLHIACSNGMKYPKLEMVQEDDSYRFIVKSVIKEDAEIIKIMEVLTENRDFEPTQKDKLFGWDLFDYACQTLNLYAIEKLLQKRSDNIILRKLDGDQLFSILYYCVLFNYHNLLGKLTTEENVNLSNVFYNGETLLHLAVKSGKYSIVDILLDRGLETDTPTYTYYTRSALHLAVEHGYYNIVELLLKKGAFVDVMDRFRNTPLLLAAHRGDLNSAKLLVNYGADVNFCDNFGQNALHRAASKGHISILSFLVDNGVKIDHPDKTGKTPLERAKNEKTEKFLKSKGAKPVQVGGTKNRSKISGGDFDGYVDLPLHTAAILGQTDIVESLLEEKIWSIDGVCTSGRTPLHWALIKGHDEMVQLLIDKGATVNVVDKKQTTPLFWAIIKGNASMTELLIKNNIDTTVTDSYNYSPLHWAAMQKNDEIVSLIFNRSSDLEQRDHLGMKPIDWAIEMGNREIATLLNNQDGDELVKAAKKKARFFKFYDSGTNSERSPLHKAVIEQQEEIILTLLEGGADINTTDFFNSTPLHWTAMQGDYKILRLLLNFQPDIAITDDFGCSALHLAAMEGHFKTVSILLEAGASVNTVDNFDNTSLDYACKRGHIKTVKILLKNNATAKHVQENYVNLVKKQHNFFKLWNYH